MFLCILKIYIHCVTVWPDDIKTLFHYSKCPRCQLPDCIILMYASIEVHEILEEGNILMKIMKFSKDLSRTSLSILIIAIYM